MLQCLTQLQTTARRWVWIICLDHLTMGGTTSTPAAVPVVSGSPDPTWDQKNSGARITLAESSSEVVVGDDKVKQAYNKGKEEGVASFKSSLEQVAAQVYDGVHTKLTEIQADSMQRSRVLVSHLFFAYD